MFRNYIGKVGQDIMEKIITNDKERDNINVLLGKFDTYFNPPEGNTHVNPPSALSGSGDIAKNWIKWKQDFQRFVQSNRIKNKPKDLQAIMLTSYIGKFGRDIIDRIVIDAREKNDLDILLQKLDKYFDSFKCNDIYLPHLDPLSNEGDMTQNWTKWKQDFMMYLKAIDAISKPNDFQAYMLRKLIGEFGNNIIEKIVTDSKEKDDVNILFERLDKYFDSSKNENAKYIPPPGPLPNDGDMAENWIKWKKDFMMYLEASGVISKSKILQALILTTHIGQFGQDIIEKIVTNSKEKDDINILFQKLDKYFSSSKNNDNLYLPPPGPLPKDGDMAENWIKWKKDFMLYLKATGIISKSKALQALILTTHIGQFGQDIIGKIVTDSKERDDINILLQRLDKFFKPQKNEVQQRYYFFNSVKRANVTIKDYIIDLKKKAATCNFGKLMDSLVRDKIIAETNDKHLLDKLLNEENLNLLKLASIYDEHLSQNHNNKVPNEPKNPNQYKKWNCKKCNQRHPRQACPAWGVKCEKCGAYNHFTSCCSYDFRNNENSKPNASTATTHPPNTNAQWRTTQPTNSSFDFEGTLYPRLNQN
ncbi:uncharacterized protein LOC143427881 [Xylocopa sonorina]|uniref:uncharacterized protein LOC143427881 n=1 Tax=Xylocopa sonorina TaxID=1818115 RepID=UPI00403B0172